MIFRNSFRTRATEFYNCGSLYLFLSLYRYSIRIRCIVSDSEPNEIKLNKWISRNPSPPPLPSPLCYFYFKRTNSISVSLLRQYSSGELQVEHSPLSEHLPKPNLLFRCSAVSKRFIIRIKVNFLPLLYIWNRCYMRSWFHCIHCY